MGCRRRRLIHNPTDALSVKIFQVQIRTRGQACPKIPQYTIRCYEDTTSRPRHGGNHKIAITHVANKMLVIIWHMLTAQEFRLSLRLIFGDHADLKAAGPHLLHSSEIKMFRDELARVIAHSKKTERELGSAVEDTVRENAPQGGDSPQDQAKVCDRGGDEKVWNTVIMHADMAQEGT